MDSNASQSGDESSSHLKHKHSKSKTKLAKSLLHRVHSRQEHEPRSSIDEDDGSAQDRESSDRHRG